MGMTDADREMLRQAQQAAEKRMADHLGQYMKFSELEPIENIITQMQRWQHTVAYVAGGCVGLMSRRLGAYCRFRPHIHATTEHAFRGCLIVLHKTAEDAARERRYEQREWELVEEARQFRLQRKS